MAKGCSGGRPAIAAGYFAERGTRRRGPATSGTDSRCGCRRRQCFSPAARPPGRRSSLSLQQGDIQRSSRVRDRARGRSARSPQAAAIGFHDRACDFTGLPFPHKTSISCEIRESRRNSFVERHQDDPDVIGAATRMILETTPRDPRRERAAVDAVKAVAVRLSFPLRGRLCHSQSELAELAALVGAVAAPAEEGEDVDVDRRVCRTLRPSVRRAVRRCTPGRTRIPDGWQR